VADLPLDAADGAKLEGLYSHSAQISSEGKGNSLHIQR